MLAIFCALALNAFSQEYEIKFTRPSKAGDVSREISTGTSTQQSTVFSAGQVIKSANLITEIELESDNTVVETDKEGRPIRESLLVRICKVKIDGQESTPFAAGTVINASVKDGKVVFDVDNKPVDDRLSAALSLVESLYTGGIGDDEVFGTSDRKKIGDSWKIRPEAIPADMARHEIKVDKDKIDGSVRVEKLEKSGDADCLFISAEMSVKDIVPKLPENLKVESSVMMTNFTGLFPLDLASQRLAQTTEFKMQMTLIGRVNPESPEVKIVSTNERKSSQKSIPGKKQ